MPGKTTLHALSFDPSNLQFWAQILCFQAPLKHECCVRRYGMLIVMYTHFVHGFSKGNLCTVREFRKGQLRTLCEVKKEYIWSKVQIFM